MLRHRADKCYNWMHGLSVWVRAQGPSCLLVWSLRFPRSLCSTRDNECRSWAPYCLGLSWISPAHLVCPLLSKYSVKYVLVSFNHRSQPQLRPQVPASSQTQRSQQEPDFLRAEGRLSAAEVLCCPFYSARSPPLCSSPPPP